MSLPSTPELIVFLVVLLLLFGGRKLPSLAKGIGESIRELRKAASGNDTNDTPEPRGNGTF